MKKGETCECARRFASAEDFGPLEDILEQHKGRKEALISIFHEIQQAYGYLDEKIMRVLAKRFRYQMSEVYGVATFYAQFRLEPIGEHLVRICHGTACHVRNAMGVLDEARRYLGIEPGESTKDMLFTLETVNCVGACALAPVVIIDGKYYGHMTPNKMNKVLKKVTGEGGAETDAQD